MKIPVLKIRDEKGNLIPINAIRGDKGKSAYEQAKEGGFNGTEEQFIALLNGLVGDASTLDAEMSDVSMNGVQNKVIKAYVDEETNSAFERAVEISSENLDSLLSTHTSDESNPHRVTAEQTGAVPEAYSSSDDLNNEIKQGGGKITVCYYHSGTLNTPYSKGLTVYAHGMVITNACSNQYGTQLCMPSGCDLLFVRAFNGQGVTDWKKIDDMTWKILEIEDSLSTKMSIATGSYRGTGTYGTKNPCTLIFPFDPKFVIVSRRAETNCTNGYTFFWINPATTINFNNNGSTYWCYPSLNGREFSWYNTESSAYQLNNANYEYDYIAWGIDE